MIRRLEAAAAALGMALLLSGCGGLPNVAGPERVITADVAAEKMGVLVMSTGAKATCTHVLSLFEVYGADTSQRVGARPMNVDNILHRSDFEGHHGLVHAVPLPPGRYYLRMTTPSLLFEDTRITPFPFEIKAGEVLYAGSFWVEPSCVPVRRFQVRDQFDRDMALLRLRNPALADRPVRRELLTPGEPMDVRERKI